MNRKLLFCLASIAACQVAQARLVRSWSDAELQDASDLVVIGRPIAVKDLQESNALGWSSTVAFQPQFRGVETTFKVSNVIKGAPVNDQVVLHHYRFEESWGCPPNGPTLITFAAGETNDYVLYLVKETAGRYAPAAGQMDSDLSIKLAPAWTNFVRLGFPMFPVPASVADADPSIRCAVPARVPTRLKIARTADTLSVAIDPDGFEATNLLVGTNMATGVQSATFVYPEGEKRPAEGGIGLNGGLAFNSGERYWHTTPDRLPLPGKRYVVEVELTAFETDVPPQHEWSPQGKNYKILWQRTLKQVVE